MAAQNYQASIGIEVHVQLKTKSKIFCSCPSSFGDQPNRNICPVCSGQPGALPALNQKVVDAAIMAGLATNCKIQDVCRFARKHYNYPDLPKNFQITQGTVPICEKGFIEIDLEDGRTKKIRLTRIHIEEDAGKIIHKDDRSLIDLNRAGTPLLELVSEPDISNSTEARAYLTRLKTIVQYLGVSDADMEKGSFRADINISVAKKDSKTLGNKVELKNINSFKFIVQAIDYEIARQVAQCEAGEKIQQETRLWDTKAHKSVFMRSKEEFNDYRYVREPDLPLIVVDKKWLDKLTEQMPELPHDKLVRFKKEYNLSSYEANILIHDLPIAIFFEKVVELCKKPKTACNWILRDLLAFSKEQKVSLEDSKITAQHFANLITAIATDRINSRTAQSVFEEMAQTGKDPNEIIAEQGLQQIGSAEELEAIVVDIVKNNPAQVKSYKEGKDRLFGFFVGQAMKATKGKGNPKVIQELLKKHLG